MTQEFKDKIGDIITDQTDSEKSTFQQILFECELEIKKEKIKLLNELTKDIEQMKINNNDITDWGDGYDKALDSILKLYS